MPRKKDTKQQILKSAFELFTTKSYHEVSIDEIIKKAGVSKGGLFHYFSSKYILAREALITTMDNMWKKPFSDLEAIKDPYKKLKKFIDFSVDFSIRNPKMIKFFLEIHEVTVKKGEDTEIWINFFTQYIEILGKMFEDCKIPNPHTKAMILLVSLDAVGWEAAHFPQVGGPSSIDRDMLKYEFYELFVGNYQKLASRGE